MATKDKKKLALGLMSGTSADGLTISLIQDKPFKILRWKNYPYTKALQEKIVYAYKMQAEELSSLSFELGQMYAKFVTKFLKDFKINKKDIFVIGSHGQTVAHHNAKSKIPHTLQIGVPVYMSALGFKVVYDFRIKDIALGGQGAPLLPFFDEYIFGKSSPKILLNVGGISNFAVVGKGVKTFGFDTGPGNSLMDKAVFKGTNGKESFDKNGALAGKGKVDEKLLNKLLKDPYFTKAPPKSLGWEYGKAYLDKNFPVINKQNLADVLATLNMLTARTIAVNINKFVLKKYKAKEIIMSGGGLYNKTLVSNLKKLLPGVKISALDDYGINSHAKESAAFALMALLALEGKSNHCPQATGAKEKTILGSLAL
ncbi:anhydro-N-acetylmuramic acid kinase [Elusimicrobium posterum]|uniref:anhydro-N-acetylmuramic acid kinase n=1 Tax=Elusimicrobium posterum TaxID=3116653 RepID=UPI003C767991